MDISELFDMRKGPKIKQVPESINIQPNPLQPTYKHQNQKDNRTNKENIFQQNEEPLSTKAISPDRQNAARVFEKYRTKENVLYDFENYVVYNKLLGEGSFSKVYLGEIKKTKKLIAIKEVNKLEENEIACLVNSESQFIIKLYNFWNRGTKSYIALELCDGNLRDILYKLSIDQKINYFEQIVEGIDYLNKKNIIHRDLKFENILLKAGTVKISDFGFAKPIGSKLAIFSEKCGTPYTMAPEIYFYNGQGKPTYSHKCDIYSLGVILHEMLYGKHPFDYCVEKFKNNHRIIVNKKFGYLDLLIQRSLEQEPIKRCNWNEFLHIFMLYKTKRNRENIELMRQNNKPLALKKINEPNLLENKPQLNNLQKYKKKNAYQTPKKAEKKDHLRYEEKRNPFGQIRLPETGNIFQKAEQNKTLQKEDHDIDEELRRKRQQEEAWKTDHDLYFEKNQEKENSVEEEAISAARLIFFIMVIISFIVIVDKEFVREYK